MDTLEHSLHKQQGAMQPRSMQHRSSLHWNGLQHRVLRRHNPADRSTLSSPCHTESISQDLSCVRWTGETG